MRDLAEAVVIVTGASRGVGAATARLLAERGARVAINYSRSGDQAEEVAAECRAKGGAALVCQGDVAEDADCRRVVQQAVDEWGRLDGLVNNAGTTVFCDHGDLEGLDAPDFQRVFAVNTVGPYQMIRAAAAPMRAGSGGAVVNVSSIASQHAVGSSLAYVASKAALNMLGMGLAKVLGPEISINTVCPGFIKGNWLRDGMGPKTYDKVKFHLEATTPLRAVNEPADVAATIVWLLEKPPNVTGQIVTIDAGMTLQRGSLPVS